MARLDGSAEASRTSGYHTTTDGDLGAAVAVDLLLPPGPDVSPNVDEPGYSAVRTLILTATALTLYEGEVLATTIPLADLKNIEITSSTYEMLRRTLKVYGKGGELMTVTAKEDKIKTFVTTLVAIAPDVEHEDNQFLAKATPVSLLFLTGAIATLLGFPDLMKAPSLHSLATFALGIGLLVGGEALRRRLYRRS